MPKSVSSKTRQSPGAKPSLPAENRNASGEGLPFLSCTNRHDLNSKATLAGYARARRLAQLPTRLDQAIAKAYDGDVFSNESPFG